MGTLKGRRSTGIVAALALAITCASAAIASGGGEGPVKVRVGNLEFIADGGFKPKTLSKTTLRPIAFSAEGQIKSLDPNEPHPPALKEFLLEADKNTAVTVKGYPTCKSGQLQSQDSAHAEAICKDALIGRGTTAVDIHFPEQRHVGAQSKLLIFNGGEAGGVITFFVHAYITVPVPAAIVTTVKIKKIHNGRYGMLATASVPRIAGGSGSVTSFAFTIDKKFTYKGKKESILSAKCPDGKLQAHGTAIFAHGTRASAEVIRTCTGKG